jgi:hypothetical protein
LATIPRRSRGAAYRIAHAAHGRRPLHWNTYFVLWIRSTRTAAPSLPLLSLCAVSQVLLAGRVVKQTLKPILPGANDN